MLNNKLNWILLALLVLIGIGFYALWHWGQSSSIGAPKFSFFETAQPQQSTKKKSAGLPEALHDEMPKTPEDMNPPQLLSYGEFGSVHEQRPAKGIVRLYRLGNGEHLLRMEQFSIVRGPGLHVYLTARPGVRQADIVLEDFIDLGELRAQSGELNYLIPADIDLSGYRGVVVFTPFFNDIYATAPITATP